MSTHFLCHASRRAQLVKVPDYALHNWKQRVGLGLFKKAVQTKVNWIWAYVQNMITRPRKKDSSEFPSLFSEMEVIRINNYCPKNANSSLPKKCHMAQRWS